VERIELLDWEHPDISVVAQADLLSLNRSSLYYQPVLTLSAGNSPQAPD
jgi:putative transposase